MMQKLLILSNILLWVIVIIQLMFMLQQTKKISNFLSRFRMLNGRIQPKKFVKVGVKSPVVKTKDHRNNQITINHESDQETLLLFTKASCSVCEGILENLNKFLTINNKMRVLIISENSDTLIQLYQDHPDIHIIYDRNLIQYFEVEVVPYLVIIKKDGIVMKLEKLNGINDLLKHTKDYLNTNTYRLSDEKAT